MYSIRSNKFDLLKVYTIKLHHTFEFVAKSQFLWSMKVFDVNLFKKINIFCIIVTHKRVFRRNYWLEANVSLLSIHKPSYKESNKWKIPPSPSLCFRTYKVCLNICTNSYLYAVGLGQTPLQLKLLININSRRLNLISPNTGHCIACCRLEDWHDTPPPLWPVTISFFLGGGNPG